MAFLNLREGLKNVNSKKNPNRIFPKGLRALNHDPKMGLLSKRVQNTANRITAYLVTVFSYFNGCNNQQVSLQLDKPVQFQDHKE